MLATAPTETDAPRPLPTYSPQKVRDLLRLLPHMEDGILPRKEPELMELIRHYGFRSWPKSAECEYHDLKRALKWLADIDWRAELAVRLSFAVGMPVVDVAAALHVHRSTVYRWNEDGVDNMASYLGWRGDRS